MKKKLQKSNFKCSSMVVTLNAKVNAKLAKKPDRD